MTQCQQVIGRSCFLLGCLKAEHGWWGNLGGTARTLDEVDGRCDMGEGVLSRVGYAVVDDSKSMLFEKNGWVAGRKPGDRVDGYLFGYGHDYKAAIKALYQLSGKQPVLPRWALGNWWSRYYAYEQQEYLDTTTDKGNQKLNFRFSY